MHISDHIKKILVFGIIVLFIGASFVTGMSKNTQRTDNIPNNETAETRGLSNEDLAALQKQAETEGWTFTVGENSATKRPLDELCGLVEPKEWWVDARFDPCTSAGDLPSTFDWRTLGGCTPIKDQGSCGSCWAFATVGSLECNIKIRDGITEDISEQWLVDCNSNGWSCNGGWFAHDYHMWKADFCGDTGAVLEQNCPYLERDSICRCPYQHDYLIDYWAYIGSSYGIPSASDIKQAIMTYGPVSVAVYISPAFRAYSGGVFNSHSSGSINHCVVLVGWDDNQGTDGVWFLRNSWGTDWGEDGYMRIGYDCCSVGYAACYVDYPGSVTGQPPVAEFIYAPANPTGTSIIQFNDTSLDPDGAIVSWWWDFGDHYYSDLQNPIHCYYVENDYTVSLTVTDDQGLTDTLTRQILMTGEPPANTPPTADFTWSPQSPTIEDIIQFIDLSIDNDGVIVYWTWEFGDGTISHYQNPTHQYTDGTYTLNLTVEDDDGATDSLEKNIIVTIIENIPPTADFTWSPELPTTNDIILFSCTSTDPDGYIVNWAWDFGDENTSYIRNPSHQYTEDGTYTVSLIVIDDGGAIDTISKNITVSFSPPENNAIFFDDFESGTLDMWTIDSGVWAVDHPVEEDVPGSSSDNKVAHAGKHSYSSRIKMKDSLDLSGYSSVNLSLWRYIDNELGYGDYLAVYVFRSGSWKLLTSWTHRQGDDQWHYETIALPQECLVSNFNLGFLSNIDTLNGIIEMDDILVEGTPI